MAKDGLTFELLRDQLQKGELAPLYLFYGEEDFLIEEAADAVMAAALRAEERQFNLDVMYAGEDDIRDILAHAASFPMMGGRRVLVLREVEKLSAKELDLLSGYVERPSPSTCLVCCGAKADLRKRPWTIVKRSGAVLECRSLYESQLPSWIAARVRARGGSISQEATKLLAAYAGTSLREIQNEIDKIFIYLGDKKSISEDDIAALVGISKEFSVFELQKAVGGRDLRRAPVILEHMLDAGENVPFILVMLTNYFAALLKLHDMQREGASLEEQASEMRVKPYFLREYAEVLKRYTKSELEHAFLLLADADEKVKTSSLSPAQVMLSLIVQLIGHPETAFSGHS